MIYNRAAHRYAKATLESCLKDKKELDLVFQDMKNISVSFENSKELKLFVDSKVVKDLIKLNALKAVFKNSSNKTTPPSLASSLANSDFNCPLVKPIFNNILLTS